MPDQVNSNEELLKRIQELESQAAAHQDSHMPKAISLGLVVLGVLAQLVTSVGPEILKAHPSVGWLSYLVEGAGFASLALLRVKSSMNGASDGS